LTSLAELRLIVRRTLGDFPKVVVDTIPSYDGTTNPINTGKDLPIETNSELITVNNTAQTRGTDYTIDYDARQTTWLTGHVPLAGTLLALQYKECVYKTEQVDEGINQGRRILFPWLYQKDYATVTVRNLVRDYDLSGTDCNETPMRAVFKEGHLNYKILRATYLPQGNNDQAYVPFRNFWQEGEKSIHLWEMLPAGYILRIEVAFAFKPLAQSTDVTDVPELAQSVMTDWAISTLALKQEPMRGRIDTANVMQANYANPPGTMAQTAEDFAARVRYIRSLLNFESMIIEPRNMPHRFEVGTAR
jgi:hypothetical protein